MRALLDTHTFLWWVTGDPQLSPQARQVIADGDNDIYFSAGSGWEIAIKARLGRLSVPTDLEQFITVQLTANAFLALPVSLEHALRVYTLPAYHNDPFDRLLVAQAQVDGLSLLSRDQNIARYPVEVIW